MVILQKKFHRLQIFNNSIQGSSWFQNIALAPGRWAVGYPFLYVLYQVLDHLCPDSILELGLGQSTKMIAQFAATHPNTEHHVIEQNSEWADFFTRTNQLTSATQIHVQECELAAFREAEAVRMYKDFEEIVASRTYSLICIDGPSAENMDQYSRVDVLKILPQCLEANFVIILDDCNRTGEKNTADAITKLLDESDIEFSLGKYQGEKTICIWTSKEMSFLCTL